MAVYKIKFRLDIIDKKDKLLLISFLYLRRVLSPSIILLQGQLLEVSRDKQLNRGDLKGFIFAFLKTDSYLFFRRKLV